MIIKKNELRDLKVLGFRKVNNFKSTGKRNFGPYDIRHLGLVLGNKNYEFLFILTSASDNPVTDYNNLPLRVETTEKGKDVHYAEIMDEIIYVESGIMNYWKFKFENIENEIDVLFNISNALMNDKFQLIHHNTSIYNIVKKECHGNIREAILDAID